MKTVQDLINEERDRQNPHEGKVYRKIIIYTHSGERETYNNVSNLKIEAEFLKSIITFDWQDGNKKVHVYKNPGYLQHSEEEIA